jgi:hypothetical protein
MKPVQIGLLVIAGAIGGALIMKMTQKTPAPPPKPVPVAQVQTPAPPPAAAPVEAAPAPVEIAKPSPVEPRKHAAKHREASRPKPVSRPDSAPVVEARNEPPAQAAAPAPTPVPAELPPSAAPPARPEPEPIAPAPEPPPPPKVTLNAGMLIPVRLVDGLSSERNMPGDTFTATLDKELVVDGFVIAERGARVQGRVVASDRGGKVRGVAALAIELTQLHTSDGQTVAIQTDSFERHADVSHQEDAMKVGAGAAVGAIIGAIAGGGKGAAIGAGVGGGAGAGDVMLTRGKPATLPSETRINFRLRAPITLTERRG